MSWPYGAFSDCRSAADLGGDHVEVPFHVHRIEPRVLGAGGCVVFDLARLLRPDWDVRRLQLDYEVLPPVPVLFQRPREHKVHDAPLPLVVEHLVERELLTAEDLHVALEHCRKRLVVGGERELLAEDPGLAGEYAVELGALLDDLGEVGVEHQRFQPAQELQPVSDCL